MTTDILPTTDSALGAQWARAPRRIAGRGFASGAAIVAIAASLGWMIGGQSEPARSAQPASAKAHVRGHQSPEAVEALRGANGIAAPHSTPSVSGMVVTPADLSGVDASVSTPTSTKLASLTPATSRGPPGLTPGS